MRLKVHTLIGVTAIVGVWAACLFFYPEFILHSRLLKKALSPSRQLQFVLSDNKWKNCILPTDIHNLCSMNATHRTNSCPLEKLTQNCPMLKRIHGYYKPVDQEEYHFPLAFGIKVHTAPEQAEQLLRAIYRPHNVYCIHVDKKASSKVVRLISSLAACFPNVLLSNRISFVYGGYDAVRAELRTMACALESSVHWKYYLNLAGQEFPLRTNLEIVRILQLMNGTNDIESFPVPRGLSVNRYKFIHKIIKGKLRKTKEKKGSPPFNISVRKGTQYSAFSRAFITSIFYDEEAKSVLDFFRDSASPEEYIWATINQLPWIPGGYPVYSLKDKHISRAVVWKKVNGYKCQGQYVRQVCIFSQADLPWILRQPSLFVNKFRSDVDSRPAACLEAMLDERVRSHTLNINLSFYENLPYVKFRRQNISWFQQLK